MSDKSTFLFDKTFLIGMFNREKLEKLSFFQQHLKMFKLKVFSCPTFESGLFCSDRPNFKVKKLSIEKRTFSSLAFSSAAVLNLASSKTGDNYANFFFVNEL